MGVAEPSPAVGPPVVGDWQNVLWYAAVAAAVAGGVASISAFGLKMRRGEAPATADKVRVLYLASYVLMSVSVFLIAFRGLVQ